MNEGREIDLLKPLGAGGFGVVWLARMRGRDGFTRRVAVKLMRRDHIENHEVLRRQRDEARLLGLLQHPNIVQVFDLTEMDGSPAVVMEYVEGVDVSSLIKATGALPGPAALAIVSGVASALEAGWSFVPPDTGRPLHVIHRDIKPANVLVTVHGSVKVLDFGVARADFDREGHTQSVAFGTPRFMAPEQFLRGELTGANDIYALGVTAWEMLTGRGFERPSLEETLHRRGVHLQLDALPAAYRDGVAAMLAHDVTQRPTPAEVIAWADSLAVAGESLRAYARRVLPGVMSARESELSPAASTAAASGALSGGPSSAPATAARPPATTAAPMVSPPGAGPSVAPPPPSSASLAPPEPMADSGQSLVTEAPPPKQGTVALMAGGIAGIIGLAGMAALGLGAAWVSGLFDPADAAVEPAGSATEPVTAATEGPEAPPASEAATASVSADPPPVATTPATATPSKSTRKTAASEPDAPVRIAPSTTAPAETPVATPVASTPPVTTPAPEPAPATAVVETAPAERKTRTITVAADVIGLAVLVDGQKKGVTPLKNLTLSYGFHNVQVDTAAYSADINANTAGTLRYNSAQKKWEWLQ